MPPRKRKAASVKRTSIRRRVVGPRMRKAIKRIALSTDEKKWNHAAVSLVTTNIAPNGAYLTTLAVGSTRDARLGNKIRLAGAKFNIQCVSAAAGAQRGRVVVLLDKQWNGSAVPITYADIFTDPNPVNHYFAQFNPNTTNRATGRYRILRDRQVILNMQGGATNVPEAKYMKMNINTRAVVQYNDTTTATPQAVNRNQLIILVFTDTGANMTFNIESVMYYYDA